MPDQHDRAVDGLDHVADDAGVEGDASQRVRRGERRMAGALELADHSREPGRVGEGTVDEDDGGTRHGVLLRVGEATQTTLRHRTRASRPGSPPPARNSNRHGRPRGTVAAAARHAADAAGLGRRRRASAPLRTGLGRPGAGSATVRGGRGVTGRSARLRGGRTRYLWRRILGREDRSSPGALAAQREYRWSRPSREIRRSVRLRPIGTLQRWRAERANLLAVPPHAVATRISRCTTARIDPSRALAGPPMQSVLCWGWFT